MCSEDFGEGLEVEGLGEGSLDGLIGGVGCFAGSSVLERGTSV